MASRRVAVWAVFGIALGLLFLVGAALLLSWIVRADAFFWLWIAIAVGLVLQVIGQLRSGQWPPRRAMAIGWTLMALGLAILFISWAVRLVTGS